MKRFTPLILTLTTPLVALTVAGVATTATPSVKQVIDTSSSIPTAPVIADATPIVTAPTDAPAPAETTVAPTPAPAPVTPAYTIETVPLSVVEAQSMTTACTTAGHPVNHATSTTYGNWDTLVRTVLRGGKLPQGVWINDTTSETFCSMGQATWYDIGIALRN